MELTELTFSVNTKILLFNITVKQKLFSTIIIFPIIVSYHFQKKFGGYSAVTMLAIYIQTMPHVK